MSQINGGIVHYLRREKTGDYEHAEASADITWSAGDGEPDDAVLAVLAKAWGMAVGHVHEKLGLPQPPNMSSFQPAPAAVAVEKPAAGSRGSRKPPTVPEETSNATIIATAKPTDPAPQSTDVSLGGEPASSTTAAVDEWADDVTVAAKAVVSDNELVSRIAAVNKQINNAPAIKALIAQYAGPAPKGARDIPQEQRDNFLFDLDAMKPPA